MSSGDVLALLGIIFGSQALWNFLQSLFQKKNPVAGTFDRTGPRPHHISL